MPLTTVRSVFAMAGPCLTLTAFKCLSTLPTVSSRTRRLPRAGMMSDLKPHWPQETSTDRDRVSGVGRIVRQMSPHKGGDSM
jgi:hypothetical protein